LLPFFEIAETTRSSLPMASMIGPGPSNMKNTTAPPTEEDRDLDQRFQRHGEDQPVLVLRRVGVARAEQDGEDAQKQATTSEMSIWKAGWSVAKTS
jgi:hypothetical protein